MTEPSIISHADYRLAWICALPLELAAAESMLDEYHHPAPNEAQTGYTLGKIAGHNVVIGCLPSGIYGTNAAAGVVSQMQSAFPNIRYGLLVGIGGGVPSKTADIRLGDIVVSKPISKFGGVKQYDLGKSVGERRLQHTGVLNQPPPILLTAASHLESEGMRKKDEFILKEVMKVLRESPDMEATFSRPIQEDRLFRSTYAHLELSESCSDCDINEQVVRPPRQSKDPQIHYGTIASGNRVIKDARTRDEIAGKFNALCFEMEAAGIMNHLPCVVIRGICDYCDSHKNKEWQGYAALVAAIYAKRLLGYVSVIRPPDQTHSLQKSQIRRDGILMVPFDRNPRFMGRVEIVQKLKTKILTRGHRKSRKAAISGLGGVGKTQVALELAYIIHSQDPGYSIFWIPSTSIEAVEQAFQSIGQVLGLPEGNPDDLKSRVKAHLSSKRAGSWLLIVDNADDQNIWLDSNTSHPLKSFLPHSDEGFVLFTSRSQRLVTQLVGPDVIRLSELDDQSAVDLFKKSLIQGDLTADEKSTITLVHRLCGLPLALVQAASFVNENSMSLERYLLLLIQQEEDMMELLSEDFEDNYRYQNVENPVSATWLVSFQHIEKSNTLAIMFLSFFACIDHRDIPLSLLPPTGTELEREKALGILKAYSFITL